ncbi:hypothetical protein ACKRLN_08930 (plasmid) [Anaerococcus sp. DFU013_CI05]|uniref:hypothetical protein n=1 Tax=Anaerococcus sp. AH8042_DFU013_CI05 TaxID=3385202 RepID=UPI003A521777
MGITKVIPTYSTKSLLNYLEEVKYEDHVRNVGYFSVGVNTTNPYQNFKTLLADKGKLNRIRQRKGQERVYEGQHIITSFTHEELNPEREEDVEKARQIMQDLMMDDYHKYGAVSVGYLQNDNGFLHFHRLYPTVAKDGKALRGEVYNFYHCAYKLDNMMEKHGVNQSILTMEERYGPGGVDKDRGELKGPRKNNRNEIKAYIAGVIDEGLKDVNINSEEKYVEYLESKDISLNKRKRVGDSKEAGYDIYDWTYEYHYVDKGPKLKDKSMKVRARQITDKNGENIYTPDNISNILKENLRMHEKALKARQALIDQQNKINMQMEEVQKKRAEAEEEGRKKREEAQKKRAEKRAEAEEAKKQGSKKRELKAYKDYTKDELFKLTDEEFKAVTSGLSGMEYMSLDFERRQKAMLNDLSSSRFKKNSNEVKANEEPRPIEEIKAKDEVKPKEEVKVEDKIKPKESYVVEDSKDKDGNGVDDYHEFLVNKRVSEIEELSNLDEDEIITEEDLIEEAIKEKPKTTHVKADLNRKSPKRKSPPTRSELNDFMRRGAELNAQLDEKDDGYGY